MINKLYGTSPESAKGRYSRSLERTSAEVVELHALAEAVLLASGKWQVKLNLLNFGPAETMPRGPDDKHPLADLPLFRWAKRKG